MGAVIGGGTAVYQCNVHGQGDCSGSYVATSAVVGAAAGAAGGLAGGEPYWDWALVKENPPLSVAWWVVPQAHRRDMSLTVH